MRSNPTQYDLIAPTTLDAALQILADSPDHYTPIAGGTELMVALGAGRLQSRKLISLWNLEELRFIEEATDAIIIGAGSTFTDIRNHPAITKHLPLLTQAASWTGSIANQNRATVGGNIVNASPAADTPPALLVYDATSHSRLRTRRTHHPLPRLPPRLQTNGPRPRRAPPQHHHIM